MSPNTTYNRKPVVLIDGDPIVYRAGFAAETPFYELVCEHKETQELHQFIFKPRGEKSAGDWMKEWLAASVDTYTVVEKFRDADVQPIENALQIVREQIDSIVADAREWFGTDVTYELFLSGGGNYRDKIATLRPYKGNRDPAHKPKHYAGIRDYMLREFNAQLIVGREADDEVSIRARQLHRERGAFVIATIDKDLDQIPGRHYNYMKRVRYNVDPDEALAFFYVQCLSGDTTDNIPGCYKTGGVKAQKVVNSVLADVDLSGEDWASDDAQARLWEAVVAAYETSQALLGCPYAALEAEDVALENARLVKLQDYEHQLWNPPGVPDELIGAST